MGAYFCVDCTVAWPGLGDFRQCPGCERTLTYRMEYEPLEPDLARDIATHLRANRAMDEIDIAAFRREMDLALGPDA